MSTIMVTTGDDESVANNTTSLREALVIAQGTPGPDTIVFAPNVTTVELFTPAVGTNGYAADGHHGPLVIASGSNVTIDGDTNGDGIADVTIKAGLTDSAGGPIDALGAPITVQSGASATFESLNFFQGAGVGAVGANGPDGNNGANGQGFDHGDTGGGAGGAGASGENGGAGENGGDAAGWILNYGSTTLARSYIGSSGASPGSGGNGGHGGNGGDGGAGQDGASGPGGTLQPGSAGGNGGNGGKGGDGGAGGHGGDGAGAILNEAGAHLTLIDSSFVGDGVSGASGGFGGYGGVGGGGGRGGEGGGGGVEEFAYGNFEQADSGPGGDAANGANGGNGGGGGAAGYSASAILNLGTITASGNNSVNGGEVTDVGQSATAGSGGGYGGAYQWGGGSAEAFFGPGEFDTPDPGNGGINGTRGHDGAPGAGGGDTVGVLNAEGGAGTVATADTIYYIYSGETAVTEGDSFTFDINRNGSRAEDATVHWQVVTTGADAADFDGDALPSGSVDFTADGPDSVAVSIGIAADEIKDPGESFAVELTKVDDPAGGNVQALGTSSISASITDDGKVGPSATRYSDGTFKTAIATYAGAGALADAFAGATAGEGIALRAGNVAAPMALAVHANDLTVSAGAGLAIGLVLGQGVDHIALAGKGLLGVSGNSLGDTIVGSDQANILAGGSGTDTIRGGGGADTLVGRGGNDTLDGGAGADSMSGGMGNDTYVVDNAHDTVSEAAKAGTDLVRSSVSFTLGAHVENLTLTGHKEIDGTGNALANHITGNAEANVLVGGGGSDTLDGGAGTDTLTGGAKADSFVFDTRFASAGIDTITDFTVGQDHIVLDRTVFSALGVAKHLAASAFSGDGVAHTAAEHILYDPSSGTLVYDSNGSANGGAHEFAVLDPHLHLAAGDFLVVA